MLSISLIFSVFLLHGFRPWVPAAWVSWSRPKPRRLEGPLRGRCLVKVRPGPHAEPVGTLGLVLLDSHCQHSLSGRAAAPGQGSLWQRSASLLAGTFTAAALIEIVARPTVQKRTQAHGRVPCRAAEPDVAGIVAMRERLETAWDLPAVANDHAGKQGFETDGSAGIPDATGNMWKTLMSHIADNDWFLSQVARVGSVCLWSCIFVELSQLFGSDLHHPEMHMDGHAALILTCAALSLRRLRKVKSQHRKRG